jgi:hypothetical protein
MKTSFTAMAAASLIFSAIGCAPQSKSLEPETQELKVGNFRAERIELRPPGPIWGALTLWSSGLQKDAEGNLVCSFFVELQNTSEYELRVPAESMRSTVYTDSSREAGKPLSTETRQVEPGRTSKFEQVISYPSAIKPRDTEALSIGFDVCVERTCAAIERRFVEAKPEEPVIIYDPFPFPYRYHYRHDWP